MKKNKIYIIAIFALTLFIAPSCSDILEEEPIGILAPESYFQTEADVEAAVMGVYTDFATERMFGRKLNITINLLDDIVDIANPGTPARRVNMNNFTPDASNGLITVFWPYLYSAIGAANSAINGVDQITITDQEKANELLGEARILRALCYYYLVRLFGDIPYIGEFVTDPASVAEISKTPAAEVYQNIIADCEFAAENLPDKYPNNVRSRPTKGSAKTMLASIYLTLGQYDKAAQYAEDVINSASAYDYSLVNDFTELWKVDNGNQSEHVWTVDFRAGDNQDFWTPLTAPSEMGGWDVMAPSYGFYDMFEAGDHRIESTFITELEIDGNTIPYTQWKYPRIFFGKYSLYPSANANSNGSYSGRNYTIFRFAEVYLIAAEALAEVNNGPTAKAYEYINKVRERARFGGIVPADLASGLSKDDFIDAVLEERMKEFALEYKRWFDIKRRQLGDEVFKGPNSLEPHSNFDASKNYLLPLPQEELDRNPNLLPQNPGYN